MPLKKGVHQARERRTTVASPSGPVGGSYGPKVRVRASPICGAADQTRGSDLIADIGSVMDEKHGSRRLGLAGLRDKHELISDNKGTSELLSRATRGGYGWTTSRLDERSGDVLYPLHVKRIEVRLDAAMLFRTTSSATKVRP